MKVGAEQGDVAHGHGLDQLTLPSRLPTDQFCYRLTNLIASDKHLTRWRDKPRFKCIQLQNRILLTCIEPMRELNSANPPDSA